MADQQQTLAELQALIEAVKRVQCYVFGEGSNDEIEEFEAAMKRADAFVTDAAGGSAPMGGKPQ